MPVIWPKVSSLADDGRKAVIYLFCVIKLPLNDGSYNFPFLQAQLPAFEAMKQVIVRMRWKA
jgi:hypothetical protein